ncbi:MAG TPA: hypothetical protein DDZ83_12555 [Nitrospinae bacterium]|nr:hypothetical protein [Nitrospinota bacterium]
MKRGWEDRSLKIKAAVLDMAGTTIADEIGGRPFVLSAYSRTFAPEGIELSPGELNEFRGLDKGQVVRDVLAARKGLKGGALDSEGARLLDRFGKCCLELLDEVRPADGAREAIGWLKGRGILVSLASGLPQEIAAAMARAAGLDSAGLADYVTTAERAGGGRPGPEMINDALVRFGMLNEDVNRSRLSPDFDYGRVLKVGDTPADVREGLAAGAVTVAVSSGTHSAERLREEGAPAVLSSIGKIPAFLESKFLAGGVD